VKLTPLIPLRLPIRTAYIDHQFAYYYYADSEPQSHEDRLRTDQGVYIPSNLWQPGFAKWRGEAALAVRVFGAHHAGVCGGCKFDAHRIGLSPFRVESGAGRGQTFCLVREICGSPMRSMAAGSQSPRTDVGQRGYNSLRFGACCLRSCLPPREGGHACSRSTLRFRRASGQNREKFGYLRRACAARFKHLLHYSTGRPEWR